MRALTAALLLRLVLLMAAAGLLLRTLGFRGRISRSLRRCLACALAIAIIVPMMVPVLVTSMPLPMLPIAGGRLIVLPLSLRLPLLAGRRSSGRRWPAVMMRPVSALAIAAWTAVMAPFALAFRALKLGLRSAEAPNFFEFRLGVFGRRARLSFLGLRAICRLWRFSVWRQRRGLC